MEEGERLTLTDIAHKNQQTMVTLLIFIHILIYEDRQRIF